MNPRAQIRVLPDGRRLHLHDGPIDLIVEAFGQLREVETAYRAACARFMTVLDELCSELSFLRQACSPEKAWPRGAVARRMTAAVLPYATECFITPMAAVAGAVAEEILAAMVNAADLSRAYVNDGGDIAWHLTASSVQPRCNLLIPSVASQPADGAGAVSPWVLQMPSRCSPIALQQPTLRPPSSPTRSICLDIRQSSAFLLAILRPTPISAAVWSRKKLES
jgi:hypothetical protein